MFILATNECNKALTIENMLTLYKSQESVGKGFNFKKPECH
jgi:transposase